MLCFPYNCATTHRYESDQLKPERLPDLAPQDCARFVRSSEVNSGLVEVRFDGLVARIEARHQSSLAAICRSGALSRLVRSLFARAAGRDITTVQLPRTAQRVTGSLPKPMLLTGTLLCAKIAFCINVHEDYELRDWSKRLGVTPERLKELVKDHGPIAGNIRKL